MTLSRSACFGKIAVQAVGLIAAPAQVLTQFIGFAFGPAEDDRRARGFHIRGSGIGCIDFLSCGGNLIVGLTDLRHVLPLFRLNPDRRRILQIAARKLHNGSRHRGGEKSDPGGFPQGNSVGKDQLDVVDETHGEHLVAFIEVATMLTLASFSVFLRM